MFCFTQDLKSERMINVFSYTVLNLLGPTKLSSTLKYVNQLLLLNIHIYGLINVKPRSVRF